MTRFIVFTLLYVIPFLTYAQFKSDTLSREQLHLITQTVQQKSIIGLGEAEHLKGIFYRIKSQVVHELILQNNFDLILFEADLNTCKYIDKYIKGDTSIHIRDYLTRMNATNNYILHNCYNTPEILAMFEWIRDYNTTHNNKITVAGIAFQQPFQLGEVINPYLPQNLQPELNAVVNVYTKYYHGYMDYKNILRIFRVDSLKKEAADAAQKVRHIKDYLSNNQNSWLQANLASLQCMSGFYTHPNGVVLRDTTMYNNLCLQIGSHKAIVWAATQHLQETSAWMGKYIREKWGQQYCNIGIYGLLDCTVNQVEVTINNNKQCLPDNNEAIIISIKSKEIPNAIVL